ncbi:MAG: ribosome maturation factor RimM [Burkholderiales bacterium]
MAGTVADTMADTGAPNAPDDLIELGRIVSAYGVRGWIKVQPHSSQSEVLRAAPVWWLASAVAPAAAALSGSDYRQDTLRSFAVRQSRRQGSTVVAELEGIDDRDIAEALRSQVVLVSRQYFPAAKRDEYYWVDLIGCSVFGLDRDSQDQRALIGVVDEVLDNGAHALLRVNRYQAVAGGDPVPVLDAKGRPVDILVPFVEVHVPKVDIVARRIETDWPVDF